MLSPVGHSLMGYMIYRATGRQLVAHRWSVIAVSAANAPDLDFIPEFFVRDPNRYHHGMMHSLGVAALRAAVLSTLLYIMRNECIRRNLAIVFCLCSSHVLLDYFSVDTGFPYGGPLLWPLSEAYFIAPFPLFSDIRPAATNVDFIPRLLSLHNLQAIGIECLVLLPFILVVLALRKQARSLPARASS